MIRLIKVKGLFPRRLGLVALSMVGLGALGACQAPPESGFAPVESQGERIPEVSQEPTNPQDLLRSIPSWDAYEEAEGMASLPYTSPADRLRQVKVGRADPFAPTETIVVSMDPKLAAQPATAATSATSATAPPSTLAPLQLTPIETVPIAPGNSSLPVPSAPVPAQALPTLSIAPLSPTVGLASTAALSPTHLADQMQLKGIVELNQQWQAIVWEPQSSVSKTVRAGDVIGNGQVKVRRIEQTSNGLLRLVLEQNGIEVIHTVS